MNRRDFIKKGSICAFAISTVGFALASNKNSFIGNCETTNDILGPFYRPNAPIRQILTDKKQEGTPVTIQGKIYSENCVDIIHDTKVEIWHANDEGQYDNHTDKYHNRAQWQTNKEGAYKFETIVPGRYMNGNQLRPHHFHFRVTHPEHQELISQIYIQGDPYIAADPWASTPEAEQRILEMNDDKEGNPLIQFDIYLLRKV